MLTRSLLINIINLCFSLIFQFCFLSVVSLIFQFLLQYQCKCEENYYAEQKLCRYSCEKRSHDTWYLQSDCERTEEAGETCNFRCVHRPPIWLWALFALVAAAAVIILLFVFVVIPACLCCPCCPWSRMQCQKKKLTVIEAPAIISPNQMAATLARANYADPSTLRVANGVAPIITQFPKLNGTGTKYPALAYHRSGILV